MKITLTDDRGLTRAVGGEWLLEPTHETIAAVGGLAELATQHLSGINDQHEYIVYFAQTLLGWLEREHDDGLES